MNIVKIVRTKCLLPEKGFTTMGGGDYNGPCLMGLDLEMCYVGSLPKARCSFFLAYSAWPTNRSKIVDFNMCYGSTVWVSAPPLQSQVEILTSKMLMSSRQSFWEGDYIMRPGSSLFKVTRDTERSLSFFKIRTQERHPGGNWTSPDTRSTWPLILY